MSECECVSVCVCVSECEVVSMSAGVFSHCCHCHTVTLSMETVGGQV